MVIRPVFDESGIISEHISFGLSRSVWACRASWQGQGHAAWLQKSSFLSELCHSLRKPKWLLSLSQFLTREAENKATILYRAFEGVERDEAVGDFFSFPCSGL